MKFRDMEIGDYSLCALIRGLADKTNTAESEIGAEAARKVGHRSHGATIPFKNLLRAPAVLQTRDAVEGTHRRALNATNFSGGGAFISQDVGAFQDALRPLSIVAGLGANFVHQEQGDLSLPILATIPAVSWLDELESAQEGDPTFSSLRFRPRRCAGVTYISSQLLRQSPASEEAVRLNLLRTIATAIDQAALSGTGNVQPIGIANTPGIGSSTFGGAATGDAVAAIELALGLANGEIGGLGWAASPAVRRKWRQLAKSATVTHPVWTDDDEIFGRPARSSTLLTNMGDRVIYGSWSDLTIVNYGPGIDIVVDPYTFAASGIVRIIVFALMDVSPIHPAAFVVTTDSGAQ